MPRTPTRPGGDRRLDAALERLAEQPGVDRARAEAVLGHRPLGVGSSRTRFAGAPTAIRGALEPEGARRPGGHPLEQRLEREQARLDEVRVERGEGGLEPGDAERRLLERHLLLVPRVRRVVGGDAEIVPLRSAFEQRRAVVGARAAAGSSSGSRRASAPPRR